MCTLMSREQSIRVGFVRQHGMNRGSACAVQYVVLTQEFDLKYVRAEEETRNCPTTAQEAVRADGFILHF